MSISITGLKIDANVRLQMLDTINRLHLLSEVIDNREAAVAFNREASGPLKKLQRKFDMPCGNTVKVARKV